MCFEKTNKIILRRLLFLSILCFMFASDMKKAVKKRTIKNINFSEETYNNIDRVRKEPTEKRNFSNMVDILCTEAIQSREMQKNHSN